MWLYTVCHSISIVWMDYCVVKPNCSILEAFGMPVLTHTRLPSLPLTVHSFLTSYILDVFFYSVFSAIWPFCAGVP